MKSQEKFKDLKKPEVFRFIEDNLNTPVPKLILSGSPFKSIDVKHLVNQIVGKKKAIKKLPTWFKHQEIIYPPKLNLEQTSSEITANHKSKSISGTRLIDLTGGFGVDDYYFSKRITELTYTELNSDLFEIARHNFKILSLENVQSHHVDSIAYLRQVHFKYDWIYVDPSRRTKSKKVFMLKDSLPNVLENKDLLRDKSKNLMIKTSPMYDIEMGYKELSGIKELHIVSVKNEVKELLWIIDWRTVNSRTIKLYNYDSHRRYSFQKMDHDKLQSHLVSRSKYENYLYEFNSSIMKSGLFDHFAAKYGLGKLEKNTNLYTSNILISSFPGKIFEIQSVDSINFKNLKKEYKGTYVNIISKNIKISTENLRKKLNCKTGGDTDYLIFAKTTEGHRLIKAKKL
ncbi:SAM-dependent methyltransferase [Psychroflexus sp. YR1-1]|uniref:SAM-dependent methyltransferase n=1 Tax=Psychroflexus aurantiacus TaxID=2709310 RepID=A0A6B3R292_9FLAO|nr:class I SAM-dependent methyltransferase [Psychroflexus aurantiacus]NEV94382.1 SAM-dependent methyltransferase [Psychroflexus aurantiacus]